MFFKLPHVPSNPRFRAYNPLDTFQHPVPYKSPFSSYSNPAFRVPSNPPHALYNRAPASPLVAPLPQPSSAHRIHSRPVSSSQPHFHPAYNYNPPPIFNQPQPTHNPPPAFNQPQPAYNFPPAFNQFPPVQPLYQQPPVQYFNQLPLVPVTSLLSSSKALPTVTHIQRKKNPEC